MSIASEIERLQGAKSEIKTSIENKGVTVSSDAKLDDYSDYIDSIASGGTDTSDATLSSNSELLSGVTAYSQGAKYTGSMANKGSKTFTPSTSQQTDTAGYYSSVTVNAMPSGALSTPTINSSTGVVTASIGTSGYLASGTNSTLQLTTQSSQTITPTTSNQTIASGKYLIGTQTIEGDANLVAGNIKKDTTIFGVTGIYEGSGSGTLITKSITENGTYNASSDNADGYSQVTVNVSGGGVIEAEEKDVNFYDYDGTRLYSYTKTDFLALESMPDNPSNAGFTAQGWNWQLNTAQTYVRNYDLLDIGQNCITSDGKTKIKIKVEDFALTPYLGLAGVNGSIEVDWGDESQTETITGSSISTVINTPHTYTNGGNYTIEINPVESSTFAIGGVSSYSYLLNDNNTTGSASIYQTYIREVLCGKNIVFSNTSAFSGLKNLKTVNIPTGTNPGGFNGTQINTVVIPQGTTTLNSFYESSAKHILIPNGPTKIKQNAFINCKFLRKLIIPSSVTTIETYAAQSLGADIIVMPASITSMKSYAFAYIEAGEIKGYTYCASENNSGNNYLNATKLKKVKLKDCYSMASACFKNCTNLQLVDCSTFTSKPTITVSNVFNGVPNTCKLIVPARLYSTWSSDSAWSSAFDIISA